MSRCLSRCVQGGLRPPWCRPLQFAQPGRTHASQPPTRYREGVAHQRVSRLQASSLLEGADGVSAFAYVLLMWSRSSSERLNHSPLTLLSANVRWRSFSVAL